MLLATSQDATSVVINVGNNPLFNESDLLDYTFDTVYASNTSTVDFFIELSAQNTIYVALAGHNLGTLGASIDILNHDTIDIASFIPVDDRPIMLAIPARTGGANNNVVIRITKQNATDVAIISHTATGLTTDFTSVTSNAQVLIKDYQSGYPRIPMSLGRKSKVTLNQSAAPTATLIKTVSQKVVLNIDNVAVSFAETELLEFQRFWVENAFFIQNDGDFKQTYMAMQFIPRPPKTHANTRELVNLSYSFTAYNGQ